MSADVTVSLSTEPYDTSTEPGTEPHPAPAPSTHDAGRTTTTQVPGPDATDEALHAWRRAATTGELPTPNRTRWQVLRCGVVNLWEYDDAEYWPAAGRAQLVGANESGKSTLMTLTTLLMLAGDLSRQYVDTMAGSHKSFRFYIEPAAVQGERRDLSTSLNRGWAWVEYGRLGTDGTPRFFTTLLHAQAHRGRPQPESRWIIATGPDRVRAGLRLRTGAKIAVPADIADLPGVQVHRNGTSYRAAVSSGLFGFDRGDQMDALIGMLKVLRTPHLGTALSPTWFTEHMREALPPLAEDEIAGLADGWDQLDQLARDRDAADACRSAVEHYLRTAWRPWADAVLRRAADAVASATTRADDVTKDVRLAKAALDAAVAVKTDLEDQEKTTKVELADTSTALDTLVRSAAFRDAQTATDNVATLTRTADQQEESARLREAALASAEQDVTTAETAHRNAQERATAAHQAHAHTRTRVTAGLAPVRLAAAAADWVAADDTERLTAALATRRVDLRRAQELRGKRDTARTHHRHATEAEELARTEEERRRTAHTHAAAALTTALQSLSDDLETWADGLPEQAALPAAVREDLITAVHTQTQAARPQQTLSDLLTRRWLDPHQTPLTQQIGVAGDRAQRARAEADDLDGQADQRELETDPAPAPPPHWARRDRPRPGPGGAPLWSLLDPAGHETGTSSQLAHLEAALAAAGLLDAWVTPDGSWSRDRDGADLVARRARNRHDDDGTGDLRGPLQVAESTADELRESATAVLASIGWVADPTRDPLEVLEASEGLVAVIHADGRWATDTAAGQAAPEYPEAQLLGSAAQAAARARAVAALRAQAATLRRQAAEAEAEARALGERLTGLRAAADAAPRDGDVIAAARTLAVAGTELDVAEGRHRAATERASTLEGLAADAQATLLTFTSEHDLDADRLDELPGVLDTAANLIADLRSKAVASSTAAARAQDAEANLSRLATFADARRHEALAARTAADTAALQLKTARDALTKGARQLLEEQAALAARIAELTDRGEDLNARLRTQEGKVASARGTAERHASAREDAEQTRAAAVANWWVPVDAGLAAARGIAAAPGRLMTHALAQAREVREKIQPSSWPEGSDVTQRTAAQDARVTAALTKMVGPALAELNTVLEFNGGRSAAAEQPEAPASTTATAPGGAGDEGEVAGPSPVLAALPRVTILVDAAGTTVEPPQALEVLTAKTDELSAQHDSDLQRVLSDLLSSTFVEHLRDRLDQVIHLIASVNTVLAAHPTGVTGTTVRLQRVPPAGNRAAYDVLEAIANDFVDDTGVQRQIREFLEDLIHQAQEAGTAVGGEWREHLAAKLDYRDWFDVVAERRAGPAGKWETVTTEVFGQGSGGSQVFLLLQPMLAMLAALYSKSPNAPRPVWLDEAFEKVDASNRATLLSLLVDFDLDFLLVGPGALAATAQVPSIALWAVTRAPHPHPGVDLALSLWAGGRHEDLEFPDPADDAHRPTRTSATSTPSDAGDMDDAGLWDGADTL